MVGEKKNVTVSLAQGDVRLAWQERKQNVLLFDNTHTTCFKVLLAPQSFFAKTNPLVICSNWTKNVKVALKVAH